MALHKHTPAQKRVILSKRAAAKKTVSKKSSSKSSGKKSGY